LDAQGKTGLRNRLLHGPPARRVFRVHSDLNSLEKLRDRTGRELDWLRDLFVTSTPDVVSIVSKTPCQVCGKIVKPDEDEYAIELRRLDDVPAKGPLGHTESEVTVYCAEHVPGDWDSE
jgi:hypothetical protein